MALQALPEPLRPEVAKYWYSFVAAAEQAQVDLPATVILSELCRVWACSDFVAQRCIRQPALLLDLIHSGDLQRTYGAGEYPQALAHLVGAENRDAAALAAGLRQLRTREMVRIAWRDIAGLADLSEMMADVSALADACIATALDYLYDNLCQELGTPCNAQGEAQRMVVIGMGKLGAKELNFSSDVDLIFAYPEAGETQGGRRIVSNEQFFTRLGQALIKALDENTVDGFVFRVDMRLRPFGKSGALALSFDAMESYYQVHGRNWERYAFIKARVVAGDLVAGQQLMDTLRPFVYRRYLDFAAYDSLREMKQMVDTEVRSRGTLNHVKLGAGGIREVEFIGQTFQLIRGGRDPALQRRGIQIVLAYLAETEALPGYVVEQLLDAYTFLRNTEHRLQEYQDQQTHLLPEDELGQLRLAVAMGFDSWDEFLPVLRAHMVRVHSHFEQVFVAPQADSADKAGIGELWVADLPEQASQAAFVSLGYRDAGGMLGRLQALRESRVYQTLSQEGRKRMDRLIPLLVNAAAHADEPDEVLLRLLTLVEAIARRTAYLALLVEHPMALSQLVRLFGASPWIAKQLVLHPILLDELLDARSLYSPMSREELHQDLARQLGGVVEGDEEQEMELLRQFKQACVLRVAAADVMNVMPLMEVSDHLSQVAEVVLEVVLELAWGHLVARHGWPSSAKQGGDRGFAMVAYGKLGGLELGYGSDLDLVFVHNCDDANAMTDGPKSVPDLMFYARLGQRIIHILTAYTPAGQLYEIDMRLRPSGSSGQLVTSLSTLREYQLNQAWTWEHQALVRARVVAGSQSIGEGFRQIRAEVLQQARDAENLRQEVLAMRERMRESLNKDSVEQFDLKQGVGGIVDVEFMIQYGVLRWAHDRPGLTTYTDNIRLAAALEEQGLLSAAEAEMLVRAYREYRAEVHRLTLQEQPVLVAAEAFSAQRDAVRAQWHKLIETPVTCAPDETE